jgi:hypothetical protein
MRAEFPARPVLASNVIVLDVAARRSEPLRDERLSWRACAGAWIGLSALSWIGVIALALHFS